MCGPESSFELRWRMVSSHQPSWKSRFVRCVRGSSRIRSSKTSPTHSRSDLAVAFVLLTTSAALPARAESLASVPIRDQKIVNRWSLPGDPHGLAIGDDGTIYVGVAQPQAVMAIDPKRGTVKRKVVLDSAEIASTKELPIESALFAAGDRVLLALSREGLFEKRLLAADGVQTERICLPPGSGPQIATLASPDRLLFAERRCSSSGAFSGSNRLVAPA